MSTARAAVITMSKTRSRQSPSPARTSQALLSHGGTPYLAHVALTRARKHTPPQLPQHPMSRSPQLTLPEKREYFDAELSMGAVQMLIPCQWCPPCVPSFYLYQSTLPFREDGPLPLAEVCRDGAQVVSEVGEHARRWRAVLEAACARWRVSS